MITWVVYKGQSLIQNGKKPNTVRNDRNEEHHGELKKSNRSSEEQDNRSWAKDQSAPRWEDGNHWETGGGK